MLPGPLHATATAAVLDSALDDVTTATVLPGALRAATTAGTVLTAATAGAGDQEQGDTEGD